MNFSSNYRKIQIIGTRENLLYMKNGQGKLSMQRLLYLHLPIIKNKKLHHSRGQWWGNCACRDLYKRGKKCCNRAHHGIDFYLNIHWKKKVSENLSSKKNRHFHSIRTLWVKEKKTDRELFQRCISTRFICALFSYLHRGVKSLPKKCTKDFWDFVRILL